MVKADIESKVQGVTVTKLNTTLELSVTLLSYASSEGGIMVLLCSVFRLMQERIRNS